MSSTRQLLERLESLPFPGGEVEPEDLLGADALGPHLAVHVMAQTDKVQLHAIIIVLRSQRVIFDLSGPGIERAERALEHGVEPERAVPVELERQISHRRARLELLDRVFGELERLGIELGDEELAEVRIPDRTVPIHENVVRLGRGSRHIVFGDDDPGCPAGGARQRLERILPLRDLAQIDPGEVFGLLAELIGAARTLGIEHGLRLDGLAYRAIAVHAHDHLGPLVRIMA
jgi:hypothetical protein